MTSAERNVPARKRGRAASLVKFAGLTGTIYLAVDSMAGFETNDLRRQLEGRLLASHKTSWPECVDNGLTSEQCRQLIQSDIQTFTGDDRNITTHILRRRDAAQPNYNLVVIRTSGLDGRVRGVWKDSMVYYDWAWNSTGLEATVAQQVDIPPVNGQNVQGITIDDYLSGAATQYIAGGTYQPGYTNTELGQDGLDAYLSTPKTIGSAGSRNVGPWDCSGLTGVSCCAMIKHSVRDADERGNALQCWIEPHTGSPTKVTCESDLSKVCIYENHDGKVAKTPVRAYGKILKAATAPVVVD